MQDRKPPGSAAWLQLAGLGFELTGYIAAPTLIGYWVDQRWGTAPAGVLVGGIFGSVIGLINLIRRGYASMAKSIDDERGEEHSRPSTHEKILTEHGDAHDDNE